MISRLPIFRGRERSPFSSPLRNHLPDPKQVGATPDIFKKRDLLEEKIQIGATRGP